MNDTEINFNELDKIKDYIEIKIRLNLVELMEIKRLIDKYDLRISILESRNKSLRYNLPLFKHKIYTQFREHVKQITRKELNVIFTRRNAILLAIKERINLVNDLLEQAKYKKLELERLIMILERKKNSYNEVSSLLQE